MRLLITGINGLLGQNLVKEFSHDHGISGIDLNPGIYPESESITVAQLDLNKTADLKRHILETAPDALIHTAAYTNVDKAEDDRDLASAINAKVPEELALICSEQNIPMIHISTDYVFNGDQGPYREADNCDPRGHYAESKYAGEQAVLKLGGQVAVIRPNVMYGHGRDLKSSFVAWLIGELTQGRPVNIVDDQYSNPSYARRLSSAIRLILDKKAWDVWHFGSKEVVSRYTFALKVADSFGLPTDLISAISTGDLNQRAPRPMRSGLICEKLKQKLGFPILNIDEELQLLKEEMNAT